MPNVKIGVALGTPDAASAQMETGQAWSFRTGGGGGVLYSGSGAPSLSVGGIGDFYVDETDFPTSIDLYGPKVEGDWGSPITLGAGGVGATAFTDLTDVPASYAGAGSKLVSVKATEDGLEFVDAPTGGGSGFNGVNAQTGTTYTFVDADNGKLVTFQNASSVAVTLPQAGAGGEFGTDWFVYVENRGSGAVTITPTVSTLDGSGVLEVDANEGVVIGSDGSNYFTMRGMGSPLGSSANSFGGVNVQTGTSYDVSASDKGYLITLANASPVAVTLPDPLYTQDSYDAANRDSYFGAGAGNQMDGLAIGQSFLASADGDFKEAAFYISKQGAPTGNVVAKLYAHSGVYGTSSIPTGAALATSDNLDISTLTASYVLTVFSFPTTYPLISGTNYVVTIEYSGGDNSNYLRIGRDISDSSHAGNPSRYNGVIWVESPPTPVPNDVIFSVLTIKDPTWFAFLENRGAGLVTVTPANSTIDGATSLELETDQGMFVATDSLNYYTQRSRGDQGIQGDPGVDGATWRSGTGAPDNGLGANGDFYFRIDTKDIYKKITGSYSIIASLISSPGDGIVSYAWFSESPPVTGVHKRFYADRDGVIQWCRAEVEDGDGSSTANFDVLLNGSSIYPSSTKPSVAAANYIGTKRIPDTIDFVEGDYLQISIVDTGGTQGRLKMLVNFTYAGA